MGVLVAEEHFVYVGAAVEGEGGARVATCIVVDMVAVVVTANVGVVAGGTLVHLSKDWWDRNEGAVDGMGTAGSRDTGASPLAPSAVQEGEDRADTCNRDCIPLAGGRCTGLVRTMPVGARKVMHKRKREKWPESCENSLRCGRIEANETIQRTCFLIQSDGVSRCA
jgi:hypothetical protein